MDMHTSGLLQAVVRHRHGDDWYDMEERTPVSDAANPERDWQRGRIFYCRPCDEEVRVELRSDRNR